MENTIKTQSEQKHIGKSEFVLYLMAVFFYTTILFKALKLKSRLFSSTQLCTVL